MTRPPKPETFVLTLTPPTRDSSDEAYRRLRAALKALWRSYGLRCVAVVADGAKVTADGIEREDQP